MYTFLFSFRPCGLSLSLSLLPLYSILAVFFSSISVIYPNVLLAFFRSLDRSDSSLTDGCRVEPRLVEKFKQRRHHANANHKKKVGPELSTAHRVVKCTEIRRLKVKYGIVPAVLNAKEDEPCQGPDENRHNIQPCPKLHLQCKLGLERGVKGQGQF